MTYRVGSFRLAYAQYQLHQEADQRILRRTGLVRTSWTSERDERKDATLEWLDAIK